MKHPKVTRLPFDCAQVLEWVLHNNCNCYFAFFLYFWTILTIRRYAHSLKLWNEVPSNTFWKLIKILHRILFFGWHEWEILLPVAQGPHSQILMVGGSDRGSYFIPPKIISSESVYPKKSLLFLAYTQKYPLVPFSQPTKTPGFFFTNQKNPSVFHRPKKITLAKISDPKKSLGPSHH